MGCQHLPVLRVFEGVMNGGFGVSIVGVKIVRAVYVYVYMKICIYIYIIYIYTLGLAKTL